MRTIVRRSSVNRTWWPLALLASALTSGAAFAEGQTIPQQTIELQRIGFQHYSSSEEQDTVNVCLQWIPPSAATSTFVRHLQIELDAIFRHSGVAVLTSNCPVSSASIVVPCEVRGRCDAYNSNDFSDDEQGRTGNRRLGWAYTAQSWTPRRIGIDCGVITSTVRRISWKVHPQRSRVFYKCAARVVAHELLHVLLNSPDHSTSELRHSELRVGDFYVEPHLTAAEIDRLRVLARSHRINQ